MKYLLHRVCAVYLFISVRLLSSRLESVGRSYRKWTSMSILAFCFYILSSVGIQTSSHHLLGRVVCSFSLVSSSSALAGLVLQLFPPSCISLTISCIQISLLFRYSSLGLGVQPSSKCWKGSIAFVKDMGTRPRSDSDSAFGSLEMTDNPMALSETVHSPPEWVTVGPASQSRCGYQLNKHIESAQMVPST